VTRTGEVVDGQVTRMMRDLFSRDYVKPSPGEPRVVKYNANGACAGRRRVQHEPQTPSANSVILAVPKHITRSTCQGDILKRVQGVMERLDQEEENHTMEYASAFAEAFGDPGS
jgi:hypothetical protein